MRVEAKRGRVFLVDHGRQVYLSLNPGEARALAGDLAMAGEEAEAQNRTIGHKTPLDKQPEGR